MTNKPFVFGSEAAGENFTDRTLETQRLLANFQNGVNSILISPRRWGKTSLVRKVCKLAENKTLKIVYLDIFSCKCEQDFYSMFARAVLMQTSSKWEEWVKNAKKFLSRIAPKISMGMNPDADFSLSFDFLPEQENFDEILDLSEKIAQKKNIQIVVCIDEFQQISSFADSKTFQKKLRTVWQLQNAVSYCLFGSKKHLMSELFESPRLPFYKFGDAIYLPKISTDDWVSYICSRFEATGKEISADFARRIAENVDNHSSYVQQLAWLVWVHTEKCVTEEIFQTGIDELVAQNSALFENQIENLSVAQFNFLRALGNGICKGFSSQAILKEYKLGSSANVNKIRSALIQKEIIDIDGGNVILTDPVMKIWLKSRF